MSTNNVSPDIQNAPTIKLWSPTTIGFITFFLGFPNGIILASINWIRMDMKGKAFVNIAGGIVGILVIMTVPDNFGRLIGLVINVAYVAYLRKQMENDIGKITVSHVQYSHWFSGLLICVVAIVIMVLIVIVGTNVQIFFESLSPSSSYYYASRGDKYSENGNYDLAVVEYTQAIKLDPHSRALYYSRGLAYHQKGDFESAIDDLTFVFTFPENVIVTDAKVYYARGQVYEDSGEHELALSDFTEFIKLQPSDVYGYANRAVSFESLGQIDKAIQDMEQALKLAGDLSLKQAIENEITRLKGK